MNPLRARAERRLREGGRPAPAEVTAAERVGQGRWRLRLRVTPPGEPPFDAHAEIEDTRPGGPPVGGVLEVLHHRRRPRVLALGPPSRAPGPDPPAAHEPEPGPPPDLALVLRGLARALGDGSLARGRPVIVEHGPPAAPEPGPLAGLPLDDLAARVGSDPAGVLEEVTRRVGAGEARMGDVLAAARRAGLDGSDLARIMRAPRRPAG